MPAQTLSGLWVAVDLGLGQQSRWGLWDAATWGLNVWGNPATAMGDWLEVTCDVSEVNIAGGSTASDGVLTRWDARTATLSLHGDTYDPWSGPYAGLLTPSLPVRIRWSPFAPSGAPTPPGPPVLTGLGPNAGSPTGGTFVIFTGSNLTDVVSVTFGGVAGKELYIGLDTRGNVIAPPGPAGTSVPVVAHSRYGTSAPINYFYTAARSAQPEVTDLPSQPDWDWRYGFTGTVDDAGWVWDALTKTASVACIDDTAILQAWNGLEQSPIGQGEIASARANRILDVAEWPTGKRKVKTGGQSVLATTLADTAWSMLSVTADSDIALCYVDRAGNLCYVPQGLLDPDRTQTTHTIVVCADPSQPLVTQMVTMAMDQPSVTRNIVSVSRQAYDTQPALTVTLRDESSIARFRPHTYQRTDLIHQNAAWSTTIAQAVLMGGAWPTHSPTSIELDARLGQPANVGTLLLGSEPGDLVDVTDQAGKVWHCIALGAAVTITHRNVSGTLYLDDLTRLVGDLWDSGHWDSARYGVI